MNDSLEVSSSFDRNKGVNFAGENIFINYSFADLTPPL